MLPHWADISDGKRARSDEGHLGQHSNQQIRSGTALDGIPCYIGRDDENDRVQHAHE